MKTPRKRIGRPTRKPKAGERVALGLRVRAAVKLRIDKAAEISGRSQSQEAELRLERSFAEEDAFGGPEVMNMARLMAAAFLLGGQRGARARTHPEWAPADWMNDPTCYDAAVYAVVAALESAQPQPFDPRHPDPKQRALGKRLHHFMARLIAAGADIKVTRGDDNG